MKEVNLKKLHTVWFQLRDIPEKAKLWGWWKHQFSCSGEKIKMNRQEHRENTLYDAVIVHI